MDEASDKREVVYTAATLDAEQSVTLTSEQLSKAFGGKSVSLPLPTKGERSAVARAQFGARLAVAMYYGFIILIAACVWILLFYTKPELNKFGMPSVGKWLLWFAPIFGGCVAIWYLVKPLRSKIDVHSAGVHLGHEREHLLATLVEELAHLLNAPKPTHVYIDNRPGITFGPREAKASVASRRNFELTIGMAVVATVNVRQLAALIAREMVQYADSPVTMQRYQVRSSVEWLTNLTGFRSNFDDTIVEMSEVQNGFVQSLGIGTKYALVLLRALVRCILFFARWATCSETRRAELEADAVAAQLCGASELVSALKQLPLVDSAIEASAADLSRTVRSDALPDDFPEYVAWFMTQLPEEARRIAQDALNTQGKTRFDCLPTFQERLRTIMRQKGPGLLELDQPASALFVDYPAACREVTFLQYEMLFGSQSRTALLLPNRQFIRRMNEDIGRGPELLPMLEFERDGIERLMHYAKLGAAIGLTAVVLFQAGKSLTGFVAEVVTPAHVKYRRHIGLGITIRGYGLRQIVGVKYYKQGDVVAQRDDGKGGKTDVLAPSTGWFYDTGAGWISPCDKYEEAHFMNVYGVGNPIPETGSDNRPIPVPKDE